jgi:hypothetical protein
VSGKALVLATALDGNEATSTVVQGRKTIAEISPVGLRIHNPEKVPFEDYLEMGRLFGMANRQLMWVIGDWLNIVEKVYPDRYSQATEATGLNRQTLMNRSSICGRIPIERRRLGVGFSIHADLAYLEPKEREKWLDLVKKNDWDRETLREHRKNARELESGPVAEPGVTSAASHGEGELVPGPRLCPTCGQEIDDG